MVWRQVRADNLLVVARVNTAIGKGGMGPNHRPAAVFIRRLQQVRAAKLLVALRAELRNDQISSLVEQEKTVRVFDNKRVGPADRFIPGRRLKGFPHAFAGLGIQAAKLAVAANAIDIARVQKWRA